MRHALRDSRAHVSGCCSPVLARAWYQEKGQMLRVSYTRDNTAHGSFCASSSQSVCPRAMGAVSQYKSTALRC